MLLLFSFVHLFIPPPSFWFPLVVLEETTKFGGSIQQGAHQLWPIWLNVICSISIYARSGGNCSCSSLRVYLEDRLEQASSGWVPELPGSDVGKELAFLLMGVVSGEAAHNHVVLFDSFFLRGDFHIADCTAETLGVEYVVNRGHHQSCMWSRVCLSSWTRCWWRREHWLWRVPGFSHLPCCRYRRLCTSRSANVTAPVTNLDKYLSGWNLGNSALQLVVETFLFGNSSAQLRCVYW